MKSSGDLKVRIYLFVLEICLFILFLPGCEKEKMPGNLPVQHYEIDSILDIDSNVYRIVKIGNQWWMAENLKVKRFRNGDNIAFLYQSTNQQWASMETAGFCYINDYPQTSTGPLYNWFAVSDSRGIAPEGWHVSTDEDWKELEQYIGMNQTEADHLSWRGKMEGNKLKSTQYPYQYINWVISENIQNTNEYGFSALPGSCRIFNGDWGEPGSRYMGFWWTLSEKSGNEAWYRYLDYNYSGVFRFYGQKTYGFSVRCVKD
jgi:uncharacterized protein (TIGR02145 family)